MSLLKNYMVAHVTDESLIPPYAKKLLPPQGFILLTTQARGIQI